MSEPAMYPLTDYPDISSRAESFDELRSWVESQDETINHVLSWFPTADVVEECGDAEFQILTFMPRLSKTVELSCALAWEERTTVDEWLNSYVRERVARWYGWET